VTFLVLSLENKKNIEFGLAFRTVYNGREGDTEQFIEANAPSDQKSGLESKKIDFKNTLAYKTRKNKIYSVRPADPTSAEDGEEISPSGRPRAAEPLD